MKKILKYVLLGLLAFLVIGQFFRIDKTNPPADPDKDFINLTHPPAEVAQVLQAACYDCHSHQTEYPWYTNVAPVSWWVKKHIDDGRKHLNFSVWGDYDAKRSHHKLEECIEMVEEGEMPMQSFTWAHPEARLSQAQRDEMVAWFKAQYQGGGAQPGATPAPAEEEHEHEEAGE